MENASKALLIAGGVLIGIAVLSIVIFGYNRIRNYQESKQDAKKIEQVSEYNKKFDSYYKNVVTGYEIISLANLADDTNSRYPESEGFANVKIYVRLTKDGSDKDTHLANSSKVKKDHDYYDMVDYIVIKNNNGVSYFYSSNKNEIKEFKELYFKADNMEYDENGRVKAMYFSQIHKK